ncbi:uncharacterized protein LOC143886577 [Tasmannia lanceolata]|uniref:uncharacterized protein LOC143886577 n=1 Tax=Tasmannia lanceolata TaxID=3420 RepID=UPI00406288A9
MKQLLDAKRKERARMSLSRAEVGGFHGTPDEEEEQDEEDIGTQLPQVPQRRGKEVLVEPSGTKRKKKGITGGIWNFFALRAIPGAQPSIKSALATKETIDRADMAVGMLCYNANLPFNVANSPFWQPMFDAVNAVGSGYKAPTYHALRGPILKNTVDEVNNYLEKIKMSWRYTGCSIMADGWTDTKQRSLINFLVYCPKGVIFLKSVDASGIVKNVDELYNIFAKIVGEVNPKYVVQFVTDSEPSYKADGKILEAAFGTFFWTPCVAHCLDLILEHLCKLTVFPHIATTIERARTITKLIYNHGSLLNLMRKKFTGGKELCRPAATRFATNFISIQSLVLNRKALLQMFVSDEYSTSRFVQHPLSEGVVSTVLDKSFWDQCKYILNISEPLVRVLRLVDRQDKPAMGYLYEAMDKAKENIKERLKRKSDYNPIWRIIDQRWDKQLHSSLHAAGYFLNPALFFTPTFSRHSEVTRGLLACITRLVPDEGTQDLITNQIEDYREAKGMFGMKLAIRNRTKLGPVAWWNQFGGNVEELQTFAIRILSQTCNATGCERNWSTFEHIHSAKTNRLEHQRLDDLVFVHYNLKFRERDLLRKSSTTSDPLSIDHLDVMMGWVAEEDVIFTPEDIGWENLEAPTAVVGAGDDDDDFLMPLEEDVPTGGPGGDDDDDEGDIEYDHPGYDD